MKKLQLFLCVGAFFLFPVVAPFAQTLYNPDTGHWYKLVPGDWEAAEAAAIDWGGHLVTINDQDEQDWLVKRFGGNTWYWIGFNDVYEEGNWVWVSGEDVTYENWGDGEPNNGRLDGGGTVGEESYGVINWGKKGLWNDVGPSGPVWNLIEFGIAEAAFQDATRNKLKEMAIEALSNLLPTGDDKSDKRIERAIEHIRDSLTEELWEDNSRLLEKTKKSFDKEKKAIKELKKIVKDHSPYEVFAQTAIDELVMDDQAIAQAAIDQAVAQAEEAGCYKKDNDDRECDKALRKIEKAEQNMKMALEELENVTHDDISDPKYDKAIYLYRKAWEYAKKAMKKLDD